MEGELIVVTSANSDDLLPVASTTDPEKILNSDDYAVFKNVPVFVEHERTLKNGRVLRFGRDELKAVADRSNRRIDDTSDFCPVVIGHTSPENDPNVNPPKIGWAGPFRLGWLTSNKDKYAILADFRIEKDKVPLLKEYPRRSAEIWPEEKYEDMYIDPISLLGADTPWSDMGVLYAKKDGAGVEKVYYSIAPQAPSAYTGLPKPVTVGKKPSVDKIDGGKTVAISDDNEKERYSMESANGLSTDQQEIAQTIVTAILESPEFKWIRREMKNRPVEEIETEAANPLGEEESVDVIDETQEPESDKQRYDMEGAESDVSMNVGADTSMDAGADAGAEQYAKEEEPEDEVEEEEDIEESEDLPADGVEGDIGTEDDALDELDEGEDDSLELDDVSGDGEESGLDLEGRGAQGDLTLLDESFSDEDDENDEYFDEDELADEEGLGEDVDSQEEDMNKIDSLQRQVDELRAQIKKLTGAYDWTADKIVSAERYAKIADLRRQYVFDDKELREKCRYNKMKNAEFEAALESIRRNNRPEPTGIKLPSRLVETAPSYNPLSPGAVQYSKERDVDVEDEVMRLSEQYSRKGISKSSEEIREEAKKNCGN